MASSPEPRRILLLSHARTACHLLEKMLSAQPNTVYCGHPFAFARPSQKKLFEEGKLSHASQQTKDELLKTWQDSFPTWESFFADAAAAHKTAFIHCHPHFMLQPSLASAYVHGDDTNSSQPWVLQSTAGTDHTADNPTVLPDHALLGTGTVPIFTIRHPALMIPSIYRTIREIETTNNEIMVFSCTLRWQRILYEWYVRHGAGHGITPTIVDAEDYQGSDRKEFMDRLCDSTGLDKASVIYSWDKAGATELNSMPSFVVRIKQTILESSGVIEGLGSASLNMQAEEAKWLETFGAEGQQQIKIFVENAMDDYEYLKARKLN